MAKEMAISRPKAYSLIEKAFKENKIDRSRVIGRTQLYKLNSADKIIRIHKRNFLECLDMVISDKSRSVKDHDIGIVRPSQPVR
jgi:hypothetical protein